MIAVVDTGPLVAAADASERDHERSVDVLSSSAYRCYVPMLVVAEAVYLVGSRLGPLAEAAFVEELADFGLVSPAADDWSRIAALIRAYGSFPLGSTDASVVALAERLDTDLIITLDQRHFRAVRPRHVEAFRLLPE